ncbi:taurine catabolism dioxygenase TauD, TfdA family-domain-containing protein [Mrakia frigida]|uniref:Aim17p n=1 Tax=Mrakia frigida TaxID=29902 RepID=UPI003FCC128F
MSFTATSSILARSLGLYSSSSTSVRALSTCSTASNLPRTTKLSVGGRAQHLLPSSLRSSSFLPASSSTTFTSSSRLSLSPSHRSYSSTPSLRSSKRISSTSDLSIEPIFLPPHSSSSKSSHSLHLKIDSPSYGIEQTLFSARWLRDSDVSPVSVSQDTGQKRHRSSDVDDEIALRAGGSSESWEVIYPGGVEGVEEPTLRIDWEGSGMRSTGLVADKKRDPSSSSFIPLSLLARQSKLNPLSESYPALPPVIPWTTKTLLESKSLFLHYDDFLSKDSSLHDALTQLRTYGLVFLKGVPSEETSHDKCELRKLAGRIGEIRNTFYGEVWDVKALGRKSRNVAYTNVDLGLHMDLLYFENPPRFQFLHSLRSLAKGGNSYFVDSYRAATTLLHSSRPTFDYLTRAPIPYHYRSLSPPHCLSHSHPLISLSPFPPHQITHLNYSPPFQAPLDAKDSDRMMDAMREFEAELEKEEGRFELKLEKGDAVIFDNRRVLHARREFEETEGMEGEERWLKGCYVDGDAGWDRWRSLEVRKAREGVELD